MRHPRWTKWYCNKLFSEFLPFSLLVIVPPLLCTVITAPCSVTYSWLGSTSLCHVLGLVAAGFISATVLCWLQRAGHLNRPGKGVKEWEFTGLENRKCVSNCCYVRCNQSQSCKFDSNLHALYEQKRESHHLQSSNRIHYLCVSSNTSHCTDLKRLKFQPFAQQILVDWVINLRILFYLLFPLLILNCVLLLKWSSHPYIVDKSSTLDKSDDSSLISDTWCGPWCDVYTHKRENITVMKLPDRAGCNLVKKIYTTLYQLLFNRLSLGDNLLICRSWGGGSDSLGTAPVSAHNLMASNDIWLWGIGGMLIDKGNRIYGRKSYSSTSLSNTYSIRITLEMNPISCGQKPVS